MGFRVLSLRCTLYSKCSRLVSRGLAEFETAFFYFSAGRVHFVGA